MVLKRVDHPNILRLYEVFEDEEMIHIVTELLTNGNLLENILANQKYSEDESRDYVY